MNRRLGAFIAAGILAAPFSGAAPSLATSDTAQPSNTEAVCPAPNPGEAQCLAYVRTDIGFGAGSGVTPTATGNAAYGPADIRSAYALPAGNLGTGLTVAVVDAYDLPTAEADLAAYRAAFNLPPCTTANGCFRKVNQTGQQSGYPAANTNWGQEIALDIDMVSATCPNCNILLVEANDPVYDNLGRAVNTAVALGAVAVSNSYGGVEWSGESNYDTYYNHPGVAITASTGDCGYNCASDRQSASYPSASQYVVAVGGTSLVRDGSARGWSESAWDSGGSGCSAYEPKPSWQTDAGCAKRTQADVSAVADPNTGVYIYWNGQWGVCGGTSASSPIIASVFALAGTPRAGTYPSSYPYRATSALFDVTTGNNDVTWHNCAVAYLCNGGAGYDGPTGLGTPNGTDAFTAPKPPGMPTGLVATADDKAVDLAWKAPSAGSSAVSSYTVTETEQGLGVVTCPATAATACTVSGLTNDTGYTFTIHATNDQGPGPESAPSNEATPKAAAAPGRPTGVTATAGIGSAVVSWAAAPANGSPIGSYTVLSAPDSKTCTTTGDLACTVDGLTKGQTYTFTVTATNGVGPGEASNPSAPVTPMTGDTYHAVTPVRLLDTRCGNGLAGKLYPAAPRTFQIAGRASIPAGAKAITANATIVNASVASSLYLGPGPLAHPALPAINFNRYDTTAFGVTVALGDDGNLSATYMASSGSTDLVLDVTGYFTADATGGTYHPITPARVLDNRVGNGLSGKFKASVPRTFLVSGRGGVPANATAVTGNLTVTNATSTWAVYIGPYPIAKPASSTINFAKKQTRANSLTVVLSSTGTLSATFLSSGGTTDLVFDVTGYYTADNTGASYVPISPTRVLDSRVGNGVSSKLVANTPRVFQVTGRGGIPASASAVTGTISVFNQTSTWAVYLGPIPIAKASTSALNFVPNDRAANGVTVALGSGGSLSITYLSGARNTTNAVLDITGYFEPTSVQPVAWTADLYDARADRFQDPDYTACTSAATMSMLNEVSYAGGASGLVWTPDTSYATQESMLAYERAHQTMLSTSPGTDPHGWRNALNYYGWGSMQAGVYRDVSYTSFAEAAKGVVSALAMYHKPVGILALAGAHAVFITGYQVTGDDPSTGSKNFTVVGVDLTDPLAYNAHRDTWVSLADWQSGSTWIQFSPYLQTDSPYVDPVDANIGYNEWYRKWVTIEPTK
jgi:hypothetical protein